MTGEWRLSAVEFDVTWRELGFGAPPYPLEVPSPGTTDAERAEIVATARGRLADRGLASPDGTPPAGLVDALTLLASSDVLLDGHLVLAEHIRLVAARYGDRAVVALQLGERLIVRALEGPRLSTALAELLPAAQAAPGQSVTLPYQALADALAGLGDGGGAWEFEQALRAAGVRGQDVRWIAGLATAGGRSSGAQFGISLRRRSTGTEPNRTMDGGDLRAGVVSWYATQEGGVVIHRQQGSDWVTIGPGNAARLVGRLDELTAAATGTA
jgi:hypothetical protein